MARFADRYLIEPLSARHDRSGFDCGVPALNRYLTTQVGQDVRRDVTAVFVAAERASGALHGYYALASAEIALDLLPPEVAKKMPRYPTLPAVRLGRLAVHRDAQGGGLGTHLLLDALYRALRSEIAWAAVRVDAKDDVARRFYLRFGFQALADDGLHLFLMRKTLERAFVRGDDRAT
jgi:GNAT superfamily N-acetyltransferase